MTARVEATDVGLRVLALAPTGRDAAVLATVLADHGLAVVACRDVAEVIVEYRKGAGALVLTEEALLRHETSDLRRELAAQETWSDIPLVILAADQGDPETARVRLGDATPGSNVTILQRPCPVVALATTVQSALRARRRQYQVRDLVRELARQAEELRQRNAELDQFAFIASHDLQEPLRMIASYTQLIERHFGAQADERARSWFEHVRKGADRLSRMIRGLLNFARIGHNAVDVEEVDAAALARDAVDNLQDRIARTGAVVDIGTLPRVRVIPIQVTQVFQNLIGNAVKFCPADRQPRVRVTAETSAVGWTFVVEDNGIGIDPRERESVFRLFHRGSNRDSFEGSGIGLATCRKIIERHGGRIWVEGAPGLGSRFCFTIPADAARQSAAHHEPPRQAAAKG